MVRSSFGRFAALVLVCAAFLALTATPASATHFRGGYIFWERVLDYVAPPGSTLVKIRMTIQINLRWTYPSYSAATSQGITNVWFPGSVPSCPGVPALGDANGSSCPPVGALINVVGGSQNGVVIFPATGTYPNLQFSKPVTITARHGVQLAAPIALTAPVGPYITDMQAIVNQVVPSQDVAYMTGVYEFLVNSTDATAANPLVVSFANSNRIQGLPDGNDQTPWRIAVPIDISAGNTKSPRSSLTAVVPVFTGVANTLTIPTQAFDNLTNKVRFATTTESGLNGPHPVGFTLDPVDSTKLTFTPSANGFYAVQFIVTGYDSGNVAKNSIPLEVLFQATTCTGSCTAVVDVSIPSPTYTTDIDHPIDIPITTTVTGVTANTGTTRLSPTVLPSDVTLTNTTATNITTLTSNLHWAPTLDSTGNAVCFNGSWTHPSGTLLTQSPTECVTLTPAALATTLVMAPVTGAAGDMVTIEATLTRSRDGLALPNRQVSFAWADAPTTILSTATTDSTGKAHFTFQLTQVTGPGGRQLSATFNAIANEFLQSSSTNAAVIVKGNTTTIDTPIVGPASIGYPVTVSTVLRAVGTTGTWPAQAQDGVTFTISGPGFSEVLPATTDALGVATVTGNLVLPSAGLYTVTASFAGNANLFGAPGGGPATSSAVVTAGQRIKATLTASKPNAFASVASNPDNVTFTLTLKQLPALTTPIANRSVTINLGANATPASATVTTDGNGVATASAFYTAAGAKTASVSITPNAGEQNQNGLVQAETASALMNVQLAPTTLSVDAPSNATVGQNYVASAVLTVTQPSSTPVAGVALTFTYKNAANTQVGIRSATTDANGRATAAAFAFPAVGLNTVTVAAISVPAQDASPTAVTVPITVTAQPSTNIVTQPVTMEFGATTTITATVTDAGGIPLPNLAGISVTSFYLTGTPPTTTNASGQVTFSVTPAVAGSSTYTVSYDGTGGRVATSDSNTLTVVKAPTVISAVQANPSIVAPNGSTVLSATLSRLNPPLITLSGETVTFTVTRPNGLVANFGVVTGATGVASLTYSSVITGAYSVAVSYAGTPNGYLAATTVNTSFTVQDSTPPVIVGTVSGTQGTGGWYTGNVTVSWSVTDAESTITSETGCSTAVLSSDGDNQSVTCSATSAGGPSSQTVTFKRDGSAPTLTLPSSITQIATSGAGNTVSYNASAADAISGATLSCAPASDSLFAIGTTSVDCTATNGAGLTSTGSFSVTVQNNAPVANNDSATTNEDAVVTGNVLGNDTDVEDNTLTTGLVSSPSHGAVSFNADGSFSYTPAANYNGSDSFSYKANDGIADSGTATVTITINAVNDAPTADSQSVSTDEEAPVVVTLTGADIDSEGITFTVVNGPSHGALSGSGATLTYTPAANYNGADSFSFVANDGSLDSSAATVSIAVAAVNDAPVASGDTVTTDEDAAVSGNVLGNDGDIDNDPLTAVLVSSTTHGSLVLDANGDFTYTPNTDFNGTDSFSYAPNDGTTNGGAVTVNITINAVNDAPTAGDGSVSTSEDTQATGALSAGDLDGNALTYAIVSNGSKGTAVVNAATGAFTYTPNANANGSDSFTFQVNDGSADSGIATVSVTIAPVNDAPVATGDSATTNEDAAVTGNVLGNDGDLDGDSVTAVLASNTTHGTLVLGANGDFTYTPNANYNGTDSFSYAPNDGTINGAAVTVNITINAVNDAPTTTAGTLSTNEDAAVNGSLSASDIDGNALTYAIVSNGAKGTASVNPATGAVTYTPNANANGSDSFTFKVNDGTVDSTTATVTVTIAPVNDAPTAASQSANATEDTALAVALGAADIDGDALSYAIVAAPAHGTLTGTGSSRTYTPAANYNGPDSFTFQVNDGAATSNTATVTIAVAAVNDAPVAGNDSATTNANTPVNGAVLTNDTDIEGNALTAAVVTAPAHGSVTLNANGTFTYTPAFDYTGADSFTYRANDGAANSNVATVSVTIQTVAQVAAQALATVTAIDSGLANDVNKITSGNPKNNCQDAAKLIDKISKSNKYTAAEKASMTAAVASLAASIPCTP